VANVAISFAFLGNKPNAAHFRAEPAIGARAARPFQMTKFPSETTSATVSSTNFMMEARGSSKEPRASFLPPPLPVLNSKPCGKSPALC